MPTGAGDGEGQNRTVDTAIFSRVLYQLSYLAAGMSLPCVSAPATQKEAASGTVLPLLEGRFV
jgi:hypothetical protein